MGWRYQYVLIGGLSLIAALIRIFVMKMEESPKWLVAMGRFDDAVVILKKMATVNRTLVDISPQDFQPITVITTAESHNVSHLALIKRLFANRKLAYSTSGILLLWMCKGIATPLYGIYLPIYLQNNGAKLGNGSTFQTYRDYAISNTVAILAPIFATAIIDLPVIGRRRGVAITAACAAAFCGGFTSVRTAGANIAFSSMVSFWQTACYAMVFSYTPEVMPTASRATGCGLAFACGRLAFLAAPFIATFGDLKTSVPLWVVFGLLGLIAVTALSLPYEPKDFPED
ncbi:MFS siderochrome iron transporter 1 [Beauveria bassiana]|nr:MFS siderochrome iron transporter 1 [Beauveria bassiana]